MDTQNNLDNYEKWLSPTENFKTFFFFLKVCLTHMVIVDSKYFNLNSYNASQIYKPIEAYFFQSLNNAFSQNLFKMPT